MDVENVLLARPRGFCAGVEMAIKALGWMVRVFEPPVYCYHEIVHNQLVVERFEQLGVVFVNDIADVPEGAPVMLSAHGSAPEVVARARASGGYVVDAVCPLVTKVHHEARVRAGKGYSIIYVGPAGPDEAVGTMAVAPDAIHLVESEEDVETLPAMEGPTALLAQTTLSHHDWAGALDAARQRFPDLWMPTRSDLCFATTNRQSALTAIARRADAIVVIGSANSSNTLALEKVAKGAGCGAVYRVNAAAEQWAVIGIESTKNQGRVAERVLTLLRSLSEIVDGFATDQLTHCLQTATLAERAGADDEIVVAALCHDVGKAVSVPNHPRIAAAILRPYVREEVYKMILVHQDFQGRHYYHHFGGNPDAREKHRETLTADEFALAEKFADEWDQI